MQRAYRLYSRVATGVFVLIAVYTVPTKLFQERLAEDWLHSVLHLGSALLGACAGWLSPSPLPARAFTWGIGAVYFALGVYGWFTPGFFLATPFAIPLGPAENIFHLALSVPAITIGVIDGLHSHRGARPAGQPLP